MSIAINENGEVNSFCTGPMPRPVRQPWCRVRTITVNDEPSMTQMSHVDQTDVNAIVARFKRTGVMPDGRKDGQYGDVTGLQGDLTELYQRAADNISRATEFASGWSPPNIPVVPDPPPQGDPQNPAIAP